MDIRNEIIERIDIVDLISEHIDLRRRGANFVGLCPFHNEKTPSFTVSPEKKIFKCFGCGKSGNVITFVIEYLNLSYPEALKELAKRAGIKLEKFDTTGVKAELSRKEQVLIVLEQANRFFQMALHTQSGTIARSYLANRGYLPHTIQEFQIGYAPAGWDLLYNELKKKGAPPEIILEAGLAKKKETSSEEYYDIFRDRITFPIRDTMGKVVGFGARLLKEDPTQPKYINSPQTISFDKSKLLFGLYEGRNEIRSQKSAILVEGYADVITLHQAGFRNAVASCGTALTIEQLNILSRYCKTIYLAYDSDEAGQNATMRAIPLALPLGFEVLVVTLPEGEDPDSFIKKNGSSAFRSLIDKANNFVEFFIRDAELKDLLRRPAQKSQLIRNILELINLIPDLIQHDDFLNQLAISLKIPYSQIQILYKEKVEIFKKTEGKDLKKPLSVKNIQVKIKQSKDPGSDLFPEEVNLIYYCLKENRNLDFVQTALKFGSDNMASDLGKKLFAVVEQHRGHNILQNVLLDDNIEEDIKNKLIDISFSSEELSENWRKFGFDTEDSDIDKVLNDIVTKIKIRHIDEELITIKTTMNEPNSQVQGLLEKYQELIKRRQMLLTSLR
ncbi:MAG: DNA primase [Candidatus Kapaibacteriales bacterium]